ncbi:hypothetical protein EV379_0440 [Microterricola gilva]|uniref:Uncharacterized protein n=1 Tax=Microterricola gilva TaxID=393267 RepID=A0A4V6MGH7_9MICO|nr:hypothetical protein EV379_0440 [Microterricola gilva]
MGTLNSGYPHGISTIQKHRYSAEPVGPDELDTFPDASQVRVEC